MDAGRKRIGRVGRRIAVGTLYGGMLVGAATAVASDDLKPWPWTAAVLACFASSLVAAMIIARRSQSWRWATARAASLDEYEQASRRRARGIAYSLAAGVSVAVTALLAFGPDGSLPWVVLAWGLIVASLPLAVLAWEEPAPLAE